MTIRRASLALLLILVAGCAAAPAPPDAEIRQLLAPTGRLRVALYPGTPTSLVGNDDPRGVGYDLGTELARRLGVPFQLLVLPRNAEVLEAVKAGQADVAFTNASVERARDMDFTQPYLAIELGYLASAGTAVASLAEIDRPGVRVGVTAKSSSDATLSRDLKQATVIRAATVGDGVRMLAAGTIDVYATNKATLFEMADQLTGARVLDGGWGRERHAIAIPKGREGGLPFLRSFAADAIAQGVVTAAVARAGLRGVVGVEEDRNQ